MKTLNLFTVFAAMAWTAAAFAATREPAEKSTAPKSVSRLPIKEVTVFKDGHAFVVHEGKAEVDRAGQVVLDELPAPVMGTFWAFSTDKQVKLASVTAGSRIAAIERTALTLRELLEANVGAEVLITETNQASYPATILKFPTRSTEEIAATSPPHSGDKLPQKSSLVLLKMVDGIRVVPLERIQDVTFKQAPKPSAPQEEFRNYLSLKFDWGRRSPASSADVGLMYVQRGIRWIPSYQVELDGQGNAVIKLQATVLNELTDLENVNVHLVIGVPSFYFKETLDPIALQETAARLSSYFQGAGPGQSRLSSLANNFDNGLMTQAVRMGDNPPAGGSGGGLDDLPEGTRNEDLFVFTLPHLTLRKGERMVLPIAECSVRYQDVFTLDVPFAPPPELGRNLGTQQQAELARLLQSPKVMHKVRFTNRSTVPFTTAPALILRDGRVIAQGLMTYTAAGASTDLELTTAVEIQVKKNEVESKRTPNAFVHSGDNYFRVDLKGQIRLINHRAQTVEIEVTRHVLGHADEANHDGKVEMTNLFESRDHLPAGGYNSVLSWWDRFSWPWWWYQVNGVGRITWQVKLDPGQTAALDYAWHYFGR